MKYTYQQFKEMTEWTLDQKIAWSEQVILKALKQSTNPSVSCSWGKDSVVMLHLVRKFCKNTFVVFANTLCEYPETYKYRDEMLQTEFKDCNYVETKPIKTFWDCVKEYGYPHLRTNKKAEEGQKAKRTPMCCQFLKEKPLIRKQKELQIDLTFIGLQATESMNRRLLFLRMGEFYKNKHNNIFHCMPLSIWNNKDVFEYAKREGIKMNPIYSKMERNGCMFCTGFKSWEKVMQNYSPTLFESFSKSKIEYECNV